MTLVAVAGLLLIVIVAGAVSLNSPSRAKSQLSSQLIVHTPGLHGQQVVAEGSIENKSLVFLSGDKIEVTITLVYTPFPGDPNSVQIVSVNDSDGFVVSTVSPDFPTALTGSPKGLIVTVILVAPVSSYTGELHLNVNFFVPPPPP